MKLYGRLLILRAWWRWDSSKAKHKAYCWAKNFTITASAWSVRKFRMSTQLLATAGIGIRLIHTIMDLQAKGSLNLRPVITHVIPFKQAAQAFQILDETPDQALQVVLDFSQQ